MKRKRKTSENGIDPHRDTHLSDSPQKMMAYGYIRWDIPDMSPGAKRGRKLIDTAVDAISGCFDFPDDTVQLQIVKGEGEREVDLGFGGERE